MKKYQKKFENFYRIGPAWNDSHMCFHIFHNPHPGGNPSYASWLPCGIVRAYEAAGLHLMGIDDHILDDDGTEIADWDSLGKFMAKLVGRWKLDRTTDPSHYYIDWDEND